MMFKISLRNSLKEEVPVKKQTLDSPVATILLSTINPCPLICMGPF